MTDCAELLGLPETDLAQRFGDPEVRRDLGRSLWLVYHLPDATLRIRCEDGRVAGWSAAFASGRDSLSEAAGALGLWPAAAPDVEGRAVTDPLVRRAIPGPDGESAVSLTATVREGRITQVSVFDEEPEWR